MACSLINIKQSQTNMLNVFLIKVSIKKGNKLKEGY